MNESTIVIRPTGVFTNRQLITGDILAGPTLLSSHTRCVLYRNGLPVKAIILKVELEPSAWTLSNNLHGFIYGGDIYEEDIEGDTFITNLSAAALHHFLERYQSDTDDTIMDLTPDLLLIGYARGIFPMANERGRISWYDPNPRTILPLDGFHVSRRLARTVRQGVFEIRYDYDFRATMLACADRETTWINNEIVNVFTDLHHKGFAHSVECWQVGQLVGGLYGVAIRGLFAGESMFSYERDASKVALVHLVNRLNVGGFTLLDVQFTTEHLLSLGAVEISRTAYRRRLAKALEVHANFYPPSNTP